MNFAHTSYLRGRWKKLPVFYQTNYLNSNLKLYKAIFWRDCSKRSAMSLRLIYTDVSFYLISLLIFKVLILYRLDQLISLKFCYTTINFLIKPTPILQPIYKIDIFILSDTNIDVSIYYLWKIKISKKRCEVRNHS